MSLPIAMSEAAPPSCILPRKLADLLPDWWRSPVFSHFWPPHENLHWARLRPFRRHAFLRSRRRAAEEAQRNAAMGVQRPARASGLARLDAVTLCRYAAAAR